ncbi:sugar ABC transporter ATP-binding protein [Propioniciclava sp. MC1683]|uniref:sugar ABC transporter ATP-binding protein n=1 Tax=Propioniciclava sp. MC1683 TaxID=2760309 RepID=UPI00160320B1|nr:sugar ABC transporter ATP-binding protein [Propioniciclava sp. MC1683]MBB1503057.1 sugar ABC transporter ATP-binding protein [Propioniciclava sp. MC1683]
MSATSTKLPLLKLDQISKQFGATAALTRASFELMPGEVHALMGENGAGKSTLMKILAGNVARDHGDIYIDGTRVEISDPASAREHKIAIIHQEINTVREMSIAENLALGVEPRTKLGVLDRGRMRREAREKMQLIGLNLDPDTPIGALSIGMQQMVEIARAASEEARILVLDEPTAALSRAETEHLYEIIEDSRARGMGLIYITHRMEEVWRLADRVTVFRDGHTVGTREREEIEPADVVRMMVGRDLGDLYHHEERVPGEPVLEVENLEGNGIGPVTFNVRAGEVVCFAGLIGSGRTEMARLVFGAEPATAGSIRLNGQKFSPAHPDQAISHGVSMVPENRKEEALFLDHTVEDNIAISSLGKFSPGGVLKLRTIRKKVRELMTYLHLRQNAITLSARSLSGGNQQKAVLARILLTEARLLILDEPTRGVDVGAKREIYELIDELARQGKAILMISSDLPEAIGTSDRILVMRQGRIAAELPSAQTSEEEVMAYATGTSNKEQQS